LMSMRDGTSSIIEEYDLWWLNMKMKL
jgi:hypothetical protein